MQHLFELGDFVLHSGDTSKWRINCKALVDQDIETLAFLATKIVRPFGDVISIPKGGDRLAHALWQYRTVGPNLIVDDVYTTGKSMNEAHKNDDDMGLVIFSRTYTPLWIDAIFHFQLDERWN